MLTQRQLLRVVSGCSGAAVAIAAIVNEPTVARANPAPPSQMATLATAPIGRDLHQPSPAENFFRQGQRQFEREIQHLADPYTVLPEDLLQVIPDQREFQPFFNPEVQLPKRGPAPTQPNLR